MMTQFETLEQAREYFEEHSNIPEFFVNLLVPVIYKAGDGTGVTLWEVKRD